MEKNIVTLKNEYLTVRISKNGAEVLSVRDNNGKEYMWQADPAVWNNTSPIVFPICGSLKDGVYIYKGKKYAPEKHGFARHLCYEPYDCNETEVNFRAEGLLKYAEVYPFSYDFYVKYVLLQNKLLVSYRVVNKSDEEMYFSVGSHEGYACPEGIEEYKIVFENEEDKLFNYLLEGPLLSGERELMGERVRELGLKYDYFAKDSLIFKNIDSRAVTLLHKDGKRKITVRFPDTDKLILWTLPRYGYICIEPWNGLPDSVDSNGKIEDKEAVEILSGGETKVISHEITFE